MVKIWSIFVAFLENMNFTTHAKKSGIESKVITIFCTSLISIAKKLHAIIKVQVFWEGQKV